MFRDLDRVQFVGIAPALCRSAARAIAMSPMRPRTNAQDAGRPMRRQAPNTVVGVQISTVTVLRTRIGFMIDR